MYDPVEGRWLEMDPIGFEGGDANLYRFVDNAPLNYTDPTGTTLKIGNDNNVKYNDQRIRDFIQTVANDNQLKQELVAATEIIEGMIASKQENKTYNFASDADFQRAVILRLNIILAAKKLNEMQKAERMIFPKDVHTPVKAPDNSLFNEIFVAKKVKIGDREVTGIMRKDGTPSGNLDALTGAGPTKQEPVQIDCASSVILAGLIGLRNTIKKDAFNSLYSKDNPFILASIYGADKFLKPPADGATATTDLLPGDTVLWQNPDATNASFRNENTIFLGEDKYYAPFIAIKSKKELQDDGYKLANHASGIFFIPAK